MPLTVLSKMNICSLAISIRYGSAVDLLRHLRHFVCVAEELHFGRAAERLGMAQPPLSQSLQRLERQLGMQLVQRDSRRVSLTPAGRVVLAESQDLLNHADQFLSRIATARGGATGGIRVGLPTGLDPVRVAKLVQNFVASEPDVPIQLAEIDDVTLHSSLRGGHLDIAALPAPPDDPGLVSGPPFTEHLSVLVRAGSPLSQREVLHLADLGERPLALAAEADDPASAALLEACHRSGYRPQRVLYVGGIGVALGLVVAGKAVSLSAVATGGAAGIAIRPLFGNPLRRERFPVWRAGVDPSIAQHFCDALQAAFNDPQIHQTAPPNRASARAASGFLT
jgi:DNA-binding transcriptional LysR family regulator